MAFRPIRPIAARWRSEDGGGLEHLSIAPTEGGIVATGVIIGDRGGTPYGVTYQASFDTNWSTLTLDLAATDGRGLHLRSDGAGAWSDADGNRLTELDGCIDIDLAGSPFTNTLPIRRAGLSPETGAVTFQMLYIPFATFAPTVDGQRYRCLEPGRLYRYEAVDRTFATDLIVDDDGLVVDYPTLFQRVPLTDKTEPT
jgi:uncharacterized protein